MDESEFLESLKTDDERFREFTDGAEHFIRMKRQSGQESPQPTFEKEAGAWRSARRFAQGAGDAVVGRFTDIPTLAKAVVSKNQGAYNRGAIAGHLATSAGLTAGTYAVGKRMGKKQEREKTAGFKSWLAKQREGAKWMDLPKEDLERYAQSDFTEEEKAPHTKKTAGINTKDVYEGAKDVLKSRAGNLKKDFERLKVPFHRDYAAGKIIGKAAPVAAAGAVAHAVGKHRGEKAKEQEIFGEMPKFAASLAEKRASAAEKLKSLGPLALSLMGAGAVAGGVGTYMASKPREELGGKSKAEDELEAKVQAHQGRPENGLLHKMNNRTTELEHGYAKAFRDHPVKASLIGAGTGAAAGYGLARLLDAVRSAR